MDNKNVVKEVKDECKKYGYEVYEVFDQIHIKTKYESWYFVPTNGKVRLMHANKIGKKGAPYHEQLRTYIKPKDIVTYVHEHEDAKYTPKFVNFSFTKDGKCITQ